MPSPTPQSEPNPLQATDLQKPSQDDANSVSPAIPDNGIDGVAFARVLEASGDPLIVLDSEWRYFYANDLAVPILQRTREQFMGRKVLDVFPELVDTAFWEVYTRAVRERAFLTLEEYFAPLDTWFDIRVIPHGDFLYLLFRDATAQKRAEAQREKSQELLRDANTRLEAALLAGDIATWTFDIVNNRVVADTNLARLFSVDPVAAVGGELGVYLAAIHPDDRDRVATVIADAMQSGDQYESEYRVVMPDGSARWLVARGRVERDDTGRAIALPGVVLNITERVERERRDRFLAELIAKTQTLLDPEDILYETEKAVGSYTNAHRCLYIEVDDINDDDQGTITVRQDFVQPGIPSMAGVHPLAAFGSPIIESLRGGSITRSSDTESDPRITPEYRATFRALNFQSFLAVPLHKAGRWVAVLAIHSATPRDWTEDEAELLTAVMERTWLALENANLFRETRQRAEREALLNQIGAAVRASSEPEAILQAAVSALGQGLGADRSYFVRYNQTRDTARVAPEWRRDPEEMLTITGRNLQMSTFSVDRDVAYKAGVTHVVDDVIAFAPEDAAPLLALSIRALLRVPIAVGDQMTAIAVSMAHKPRHWTGDEIRLVENVATLLHSALESALVQQRERNIAQQLQAALQPEAPAHMPGLALSSFYRPALDESSVGGDFYDVFRVGEGCTALVVADLSGKGLQAASQVALVRNNLRFALYNAETVADAVNTLHRTLVEYDLLTGFATLFVGLYDNNDQTLTYANCGQEPGLIWRAATGEVEQLAPTGPVLGGFISGDHANATTRLAVGDVIFAGTDGMTEVGPSRKQFLEVSGLSALFARCADTASRDTAYSWRTPTQIADDIAGSVVDHLISGVEAYAGSAAGLRDDIALLVGVVTDSGI